MPVLRVDAQFTVIEAALKGYVKWRSNPKSEENIVRALFLIHDSSRTKLIEI